MKETHTILLYYCYTPIEDVMAFSKAHHDFCVKNQLLGRIIIAEEGINGTISGPKANCERYMQNLRKDKRFVSIDFKVTPSKRHVFQKLNIRIKREIVHAGLPHINPCKRAGQYISVELFEKMRKEDNVVLLDARSNYEHRLGRFKNAITLDIDHFREFAKKVKTLDHLKNKKIITYCTGGVKCEKASAYLLEKSFKNVYQLQGGIIRYGQKTHGSAFEGTCYVFDSRLSVPINKTKPTIISICHTCEKPCERMVNCANPKCNKHIPMCHDCCIAHKGACSKTCKEDPSKRNYNNTGYYITTLNGYNPSQALRK